MNFTGLIFIAIGIYALCGAVFNWDWFIMGTRAEGFVWLFGRRGARVVWAVLGAITLLGGLLAVLGILSL